MRWQNDTDKSRLHTPTSQASWMYQCCSALLMMESEVAAGAKVEVEADDGGEILEVVGGVKTTLPFSLSHLHHVQVGRLCFRMWSWMLFLSQAQFNKCPAHPHTPHNIFHPPPTLYEWRQAPPILTHSPNYEWRRAPPILTHHMISFILPQFFMNGGERSTSSHPYNILELLPLLQHAMWRAGVIYFWLMSNVPEDSNTILPPIDGKLAHQLWPLIRSLVTMWSLQGVLSSCPKTACPHTS